MCLFVTKCGLETRPTQWGFLLVKDHVFIIVIIEPTVIYCANCSDFFLMIHDYKTTL